MKNKGLIYVFVFIGALGAYVGITEFATRPNVVDFEMRQWGERRYIDARQHPRSIKKSDIICFDSNEDDSDRNLISGVEHTGGCHVDSLTRLRLDRTNSPDAYAFVFNENCRLHTVARTHYTPPYNPEILKKVGWGMCEKVSSLLEGAPVDTSRELNPNIFILNVEGE